MTLEKIGVEPITREFFFFFVVSPALDCVALGVGGLGGKGRQWTRAWQSEFFRWKSLCNPPPVNLHRAPGEETRCNFVDQHQAVLAGCLALGGS